MKTDFNREQFLTILGIVGLLAGLLVLPFILQRYYGIDAVKTSFGVIILYALINWLIRKDVLFNR